MSKNILLGISMLLAFHTAIAQTSIFFDKADAFFKAYVHEDKVDYKAIVKHPEDLKELFEIAGSINVDVKDQQEYQAFWINAYNLSVIKGVVDNFPLKSPLDISGFFDKTTYALAGKKITLNDIEHKLLRGQFKDPRFHFVLVCGALGCPPLINQAYVPDNLETLLESQTFKSLNGSFVKVNKKKKRVEGSEILKWYKEDFLGDGSEINFINRYRTDKIPENYKLTYYTYNWNLNIL